MKGIEAAFIGVLSKDPELKQGKNGKNYANFSCTASSEAGEPQWINVITFNEVAENLVKVTRKGDKVYCEGNLTLAKWESADGEARSGLAVSAWRVDLIGAANLGRNRVENPRVQSSFPIVLPAIRKKKYGLFRKKTKPQVQDLADNGRPFDDPIDF